MQSLLDASTEFPFTLRLGPEVPIPEGDNGWPGDPVRMAWRTRWSEAIWEAIREHDAWVMLVTASDGDVILRDVVANDTVWHATTGYSVQLLLAEEVKRKDGCQ
jgi:hypothetical protein